MLEVGSTWPGDIGTILQKVAQGLGGKMQGTGVNIVPQPKPNIMPNTPPTAGDQLAAAPAPAAQAPVTPGQPQQPTGAPSTMPISNQQPKPTMMGMKSACEEQA